MKTSGICLLILVQFFSLYSMEKLEHKNVSSFIAGRTQLYIACRDKNFDLVKAYIENGANINEANITGKTPLWIASKKNHIGIVQYLILKGASIEEITVIKTVGPYEYRSSVKPLFMMKIGNLSIVRNKLVQKKIKPLLIGFFKKEKNNEAVCILKKLPLGIFKIIYKLAIKNDPVISAINEALKLANSLVATPNEEEDLLTLIRRVCYS